MVSGDAGAGKTALVRRWLAMDSANVDVAFGHCHPSCQQPLGAWRAALALAQEVEGADRPGEVSSIGSGRQREVHLGVLADALLARRSRRPLVVVLDDAQWIDDESAALSRLLHPYLADHGVAVVATVRTGEASLDTTLDRLLAPGARPELVVSLHGLPLADIADLVGAPAGSPIAATIARRTGGNPLFVTELARLVDDARRDDLEAWEAELPPTVQAVLSRRLAAMSPATRQVLCLAAVADEEIDLDLLCAASAGRGIDASADVLAAIDEATAAALVVWADGRPRFSHGLVREVLAATLTPSRRRCLHRGIAAAAATLPGTSAAMVARHASAGAERAADRVEAAGWAAAAARQAASCFAWTAAADWYQQALALAPAADADRLERLIGLGLASSKAGRSPTARRALEDAAGLALELGDHRSHARAVLAIGTIGGLFEVQINDVAQRARLRLALTVIGEEPTPVRARLLARASVAESMHGDQTLQHELATEAIDVARSCNDPTALAEALAAGFDACSGPQHLGWRLHHLEPIEAAALASGDPELEALARRHRLATMQEAGRFAAVRAEAEAFAGLAARLGQPAFRWYAEMIEGGLALLAGDLERAGERIDAAVELGESAGSVNATLLATWSQRSALLMERGDVAAALANFTACFERHPDMTMGLDVGSIVLCDRGVESALVGAAMAAVPDAMIDHLPMDGGWLHVLWCTANAAAATGAVELARRAAALLEPFADHVVSAGLVAVCEGTVASALARVAAATGDTAAAQRWFARAIAAAVAWPAPRLVARLRAEQAALDARPARAALPVANTATAASTAAASSTTTAASTTAAAAAAGRAAMTGGAEGPAWIVDGDGWVISYDGHAVRVRDSKGVRDLRTLLAAQGREVHVLDLASASAGACTAPAASAMVGTLDAQARHAYEARIRELQDDIEEARAANDGARADRAETEQEWLVAELARSLGLRGRQRRSNDNVERARKAVAMRIRDALERLGALHPGLARHLRNSVSTGTYCAYRPEREIAWRL